MEIAKARPPLVQFEIKEYGFDAEESEKQGRPVPREVAFAMITSAGGKDVFEKPAVEWLADIRRRAVIGQYDPDWVKQFDFAYEEWKKGNEIPVNGTPLRTSLLFTKDQIRRCIAINILTIEDLGTVADSDLGRLGMDGRYIRDKARAALETGSRVAQENAALKVQVSDLTTTVARLGEQLAEMQAATGGDQKKRGRADKET